MIPCCIFITKFLEKDVCTSDFDFKIDIDVELCNTIRDELKSKMTDRLSGGVGRVQHVIDFWYDKMAVKFQFSVTKRVIKKRLKPALVLYYTKKFNFFFYYFHKLCN